MRIAALALGVLAGLVASLILALGGLDAGIAALAHGGDRQAALLRFALFVVGNLGILGAGVVLASPIGGAVLFLLGAIGWAVMAFWLRHGLDYVVLTSPGLLLVAFAISIVAFVRAPQRRTAAQRQPILPLQSRMQPADLDPEDFEELPPVPVGAGFFGHGGTAMPLDPEAASQPAAAPLRGLDQDDPMRADTDDWRPGKRRPPPPRQKSMFREPGDDDEEDEENEEESGFARVARGLSGVLSFGLYAALAAAAVLIVWNVRSGDTRATATKVDIQSSSVAADTGPSAPRTAPVLGAGSSAAPAPLLSAASSSTAPLVATAEPSAAPVLTPQSSPASSEAESDLLPAGTVIAPGIAVAPDTVPTAPASAAPQVAGPSPADDTASTDAGAAPGEQVMPFIMPSAIAAQRAGGSAPRTAPPASRPPANDTGM